MKAYLNIQRRSEGRKRERTFPKLIFISRVYAYLIESA